MWEIALLIVVAGAMSYLFGFWDHLAAKAGVTVPQAIGSAILVGLYYVLIIIVTYFVLAYCHKWFGHIIFGG